MVATHPLLSFGWNEKWQALFSQHAQEGDVLGRVVTDHGRMIGVVVAQGESVEDWLVDQLGEPVTVGDWVVLRKPPLGENWYCVQRLPRTTALTRVDNGQVLREQTIAANIDIVFLLAPLEGTWRPRRVERFLSAAWTSGAQPVLLLSKCDLHEDTAQALARARDAFLGVEVHAISVRTDEGIESVREISAGKSCVLLGMSGAGKSSLINALLGEEAMSVQEVRQGDRRGKHTTTHRQVLQLPGDTLFIDTPGVRELGLWGEEGVRQTFSDLETLARDCRFSDCHHDKEPGCALRAAIAAGTLAEKRLLNYKKLQKEAAHVQRVAAQQSKQRLQQRDKVQREKLNRKELESEV